MLKSIRKFSNTIFAKIFLFIVAIPFIFWGMGNLFQTGNLNTIVKIDKEKISTKEFIKYINNYPMPEQKLDSKLFDEILNSFIVTKLISKEIENLDIKLSDVSLKKIIKNQKAFKKGNTFSRVEYEKFLISNSLNVVSFEANLANQEKKKQLLEFIGRGIVPPNFLVNINFNKVNQKRNVHLIDLNDVLKQEINFSEKDIKLYFNQNKENYKDTYKSIKFAELDPKNLTDKNEFNDLFFKKIDEIDDLIIEGASLDFILQKYNLISSDIITLNDTGKNKSSTINDNFPTGLAKKVFEINEAEPSILTIYEDKYFLIELISTEDIYKKIKDSSVKKDIINNLKKNAKRKLISNFIDKINKNNFQQKDFNELSKEKNVITKKVKLENLNDNKVLKEELVNQIYSIPEKKVFLVADIGLQESYLVFIENVENKTISQSSEDYKKYHNLSKAKIKSDLFNTYNSYLNQKYKIDINYNALDNVKSNIQ